MAVKTLPGRWMRLESFAVEWDNANPMVCQPARLERTGIELENILRWEDNDGQMLDLAIQ